MSSSSSSRITSVCQTCGSRGFSQALVVCSKCHIIVEHTYCLNNLPETNDDEVRWACEFCEARVIELSDSTNSDSDTEKIGPFKYIKGAQDDAADPICPLISEEAERVADADTSPSTKNLQSFCKEFEKSHYLTKQDDAAEPICPLISEEAEREANADASPSIKNLQSFCREFEKSHYLIKQEHDIVGDLHLPCKNSEAPGAEVSRSGSPETSTILDDDFWSTIEPLPDPIWMGNFHIYGNLTCTVHGVLAHISNETGKEASEVASALPAPLCLEIVPKINIWPLKFMKVMPTIEDIAVFFFPEDYRAERVYDCLVDNIIEHDFAMIARVNNVELLVFSSCELPRDNWRFQRKYYLWGMFRRKKKTLPQNQKGESSSSIQGNINHIRPSNSLTKTGAKETEGSTGSFGSSPPIKKGDA